MTEIHSHRTGSALDALAGAVHRRRAERLEQNDGVTIDDYARLRRARDAGDQDAYRQQLAEIRERAADDPEDRPTPIEALKSLHRHASNANELFARIGRDNGHDGTSRIDGITIGTKEN